MRLSADQRAPDARDHRAPGRRSTDRQPAPALTTTMVALAWSIIHLDDDGESADVLAKLIVEAAEAQA